MIGAARQQLSARLMESLVHEARNPLNALSINIGVLAQKLRAPGGAVPPGQERNLSAMREQIARVDEVLKLFNDFMSQRPMANEVDFSHAVDRAIAALGHEIRRAQVRLEAELAGPQRTGINWESGALSFLAAQPILRGLARSRAGGAIRVRLAGTHEKGLTYTVEDSGDDSEPFDRAVPALQRMAARAGGAVKVEGALFEMTLPLAGR